MHPVFNIPNISSYDNFLLGLLRCLSNCIRWWVSGYISCRFSYWLSYRCFYRRVCWFLCLWFNSRRVYFGRRGYFDSRRYLGRSLVVNFSWRICWLMLGNLLWFC